MEPVAMLINMQNQKIADTYIEEDKTQKEYYNDTWSKYNGKTIEDKCYGLFVVNTIKKIKKEKKKINILDLGCGRGWLTNELNKYGYSIGIDRTVDQAIQSYPNIDFECADIIKDEIEGKYDVIVSCAVLEHIKYTDKMIYLEKAHDLLRDNGHIIIITPDNRSAGKLKKLGKQPIEDWTPRKELKKMLDPMFRCVHMGSSYFYPQFLENSKTLSWIYYVLYGKLLYKLIEPLIHHTELGICYTYIGIKR